MREGLRKCLNEHEHAAARESSHIMSSVDKMQGIQVPHYGNTIPGSVHTLVRDETDTIYCSDELNHRILSFSSGGEVRWIKGRRGTAAGEFHYPRGISLGVFRFEDRDMPCLAVCDAWNNRVQIMDKDGEILAVWTEAGNRAFYEVTDVRFIHGNEKDGHIDGYWLLLDRSNHRLCALNIRGETLFTIGRGMPPLLFSGCVGNGLGFVGDLPSQRSTSWSCPIDFLYYPSRILGNSECALFIWEPYARQLKQAFRGNIFPLPFLPDKINDWIAAGDAWLLGFDSNSKCITILDSQGNQICEAKISGTPIASNSTANEFWSIEDDFLVRWKWDREIAERPNDGRISGTMVFLKRSAEWHIDKFRKQLSATLLEELLYLLHARAALAAEFVKEAQSQLFPSETWLRWCNLPQDGDGPQLKLRKSIYAASHHYYIAQRESKIVASERDGMPDEGNACVLPSAFGQRIMKLFETNQSTIAELEIFRWILTKPPITADKMTVRLSSASAELACKLEKDQELICELLGEAKRPTEERCIPSLVVKGDTLLSKISPHATILRRNGKRSGVIENECLCEVDRVSLIGTTENANGKQLGLARTTQGETLISLFEKHQILRLNKSLQPFAVIGQPGCNAGELQGPSGLVSDAANQVWVSEHLNHRIQVFDLSSNNSRIIPSTVGPFLYPTGICLCRDLSMLVADSGNHRVVRITQEEKMDIFCDKVGSALGQIWYPCALCTDNRGSVFVIERGNHRIQIFSENGEPIGVIGACGLNRSSLFRPNLVAVFDDQMIAVTESTPAGSIPWRQSLKLFSKTGELLGVHALDYMPGGMIIYENRILLTAFDDSNLRIYERK
jgi:hypothetical protein